MIPSPSDNHGLETNRMGIEGQALYAAHNPDFAQGAPAGDQDPGSAARVQAATGISEQQLLQMVQQAESIATTYLNANVRSAWERSYKAWRNEHFAGSKYLSSRYRTRSKLFRPKTRSAVRKSMASAAQALFSTSDVVSVEAQDTGDPLQLASAAVKQEILNYRLDRTSGRNAIPWFLTAMGSEQTAQITGICVSKQFWLFEEEETGEGEDIPGSLDPATGKPFRTRPKEILKDRPECLLVPSENVLLDVNCDWRNPAQSSNYMIVRFPMAVMDVKRMIQADDTTEWIPLSDQVLMGAAGSTPTDIQSAKRAREGGGDTDQAQGQGEYKTVWVWENFLRIKGRDFVFWTLGKSKLLSVPQPVRKAYPAFHGERPYVIGFGSIDAHRVFPMAPVESWQPLQQEANDITNLRLDQMKHVVNPPAKVKRGAQIDTAAVQNRGPDGLIFMNDVEKDLAWDRPPDVPPSAYAEGDRVNADFDELSGTFSTSSVQSNRQLNETVGGMRLLSGGASSMTEFDLRVWVETWAEPALAQIVRLEEYYESDEKILMFAGEKANLVQKYGIDEITDQFLMAESSVRINVGMGAADPMQKIAKFTAATDAAAKILAPFVQMGLARIRPKSAEIINECFGPAGYKDAAERFFFVGDEEQDPTPPGPEGGEGAGGDQPDPYAAQAQIHETNATIQDKERERQWKSQENAKDRELKILLEEMKGAIKAQGEQIKAMQQEKAQANQLQADMHNAHQDRQFAQQNADKDRVARIVESRRNPQQPGQPQQQPQQPPQGGPPQQQPQGGPPQQPAPAPRPSGGMNGGPAER